ncbi:hypothetical protein RIU76_08475 [Latilactobacillus sakei subsp. sakei]|uniref:hypothetical protein n=1 Tax=Latilactobacillus TaxID=2767885 RepID=UPI0005052AF0|nr:MULTISPECIES: hypothetical protein [Latilactobacillus]AOO75983.1 hypothetical protein LCW_07915 [Latilactobacillus curvatus]KGB14230.1 hypothetical protein KY41_08370 [Latilactobacillus sakei]MDR7924728.1 hypothetical protein [Latilactobacillus sakei subsp. sakei]
MNTAKVLQAIIQTASNARPGDVNPNDVKSKLDMSDSDFAQSLIELEDAGYLERIMGNNQLMDISITTKVPTE